MTTAVKGDWNCECMVCRRVVKASETRTRWDNLIVCTDDGCWEMRHPLDMPSPPFPVERTLPFTAPEGPETEVSITYSALATALDGVPVGTFDDNNGTI